ncbi:MAG: MmgE/PrpD family protein [Alphaproteobacteria bacterium]|nr:MmgE/PrpD family protein [Alphaproteobacteria bacterium]MCB9929015.1 MmgE/PrpD family protein [Alphaproteobacteria bacterium]
MNAPSQPQTASAAKASAGDATIARQLALFADNLSLGDVPERVVQRAKLHILDCLGIALASTTFEFAQRAATAIGGLAGAGDYPAIGMPLALPLRDQVLLNGTLIHGLDYDDTHTAGVIHASASALATALGQALKVDASGGDLLAAYLVGVETAARIGAAAQGGFHVRGHHPTGLVGAFGATLAAGKLAGLPVHKLCDAQGIALSMAAGSLEFLSDGAWTKRMHPGWAGVAGITATALANEGFQGPSKTYEGRYGLFNLHLGADNEADLGVCTAGLGRDWELEQVGFKPYPACHFNHSFADAALAMRADGITADAIERITALIHPTPAQVVCEPLAAKQRPANAYEAQFSVPYIVAQSLLRGRFTLDELDPAAYSEEAALDLAAKVDWAEDPNTRFPRYYSGEIVVQTKDGRTHRYREDVNRGSDANPLTAADIEAKFWANATRAVNRVRAERVFDAVMGLDKAADGWALMDALAAG